MRLALPLALLCTACTWFEGDESPCCDAYEGNYDDECTNGVDEDEDGLFDCDDETCEGSPDCSESASSEDAESA